MRFIQVRVGLGLVYIPYSIELLTYCCNGLSSGLCIQAIIGGKNYNTQNTFARHYVVFYLQNGKYCTQMQNLFPLLFLNEQKADHD